MCLGSGPNSSMHAEVGLTCVHQGQPDGVHPGGRYDEGPGLLGLAAWPQLHWPPWHRQQLTPECGIASILQHWP